MRRCLLIDPAPALVRRHGGLRLREKERPYIRLVSAGIRASYVRRLCRFIVAVGVPDRKVLRLPGVIAKMLSLAGIAQVKRPYRIAMPLTRRFGT